MANFKRSDPTLDKSVYEVLGVEKAVEAMSSYGSTNPAEVGKQVRAMEKNLGIA